MNNKWLVALGVVFLFILAWYTVGQKAVSLPAEYESFLEEARKQTELKCYENAIDNYKKALVIKDNDIAIHVELARQYLYLNKERAFVDKCVELKNRFLRNDTPYLELARFYLEKNAYLNCARTVNEAKERNAYSDALKQIEEQIKYKFEIKHAAYDDVQTFSNGFCSVRRGDLWGFVDVEGTFTADPEFQDAGSFSAEVAPVKKNDEYFYVDSIGIRRLASSEKYDSLGMLSVDNLAAVSQSGRHFYVNKDFQKKFGDYDFAGSFTYSIAAVKKGNKWALVDTDGNDITAYKFDDIKLDEKQSCFRNGVAFAKEGSGYFLIDNLGNKISEKVFDNVVVFAGNEPAAVELNGKWGFVDNRGNIVIEPEYEQARSFINGLAAVKVNDKWGFITPENKIVIEPQFLDVKDFDNMGSAFVKNSEKWKLIRFYMSMV